MIRSLLFFILAIVPFAAFSNSYVVISGFVTDTNGNAVSGIQVTATAYDSITPVYFTTHTDGNGYYEDTLFFNQFPAAEGWAWIIDCDNDTLSNYNQWGGATSAQIDFIYCQNPGAPSCQASFAAQAGSAPLTYYFYNQSAGDSIWYTWTFGDGASSTDPHPQHTYANPGTYQVCLEIWDSTGCHDIQCDSIVVGSNCLASFSTQVNDSLVTFFNNSQGSNLSYLWTFDDGHTSTQANPTHVYQSAGTYLPCLVITDNQGCTDTVCQSVTIPGSTGCEALFSHQVSGNTVFFTNGSAGNLDVISWTLGDGNASGAYDPIHTYSGNGQYVVCLTVEDTVNQCIDTYCDTVVINSPSNCDADFSFQVNDSLVNFYNGSTGSSLFYNWHFGDGHTSNQENPTHIYQSPGYYEVCLVVTDNQSCTDSICKTIFVGDSTICNAQFGFTITGNTAQFNNQSSGSYNLVSWTFGDGTGSSAQNPHHTYASSGSYEVCLTVEDTNTNCIDTYCDTVVVTSGCAAAFQVNISNDTAYFTNNSTGQQLSYQWDFGDGHTDSLENPYHVFDSAGTYQVCLDVHAPGGCTDHYCQQVTISENCHAHFTYQSATNNGLEIYFQNLSQGDSLSYQWHFGDSSTSTQEHPVHSYSHAGVYYVCLEVWDAGGCYDIICDSVVVDYNCEAGFSFQIDQNNNTVNFTNSSLGDSLTYLWHFGDSTTSTAANPQHTYTPGIYTVCLEIWSANGCYDIKCDTVAMVGCQAQFSYTVHGKEVTFSNQSSGAQLQYTYDFGDGDSAHVVNPVHEYDSAGTYLVCLTVENSFGCHDQYCDTIVIDTTVPDSTFFIQGHVFAGNNISTNFHAALYKDSSGIWNPVDTQYIDSTIYHFAGLDSGTYYVLAWLDSSSPHFSQYMPTYHDSASYWQNATAITVGPNYINGDVYLLPSPPVNGNGYIGGNVTEGSGKTWGAGKPIPNATVYLRNDQEQPILHDHTNANGHFSFEDVEQGFYTLYVEMVNHECKPFAVTVNTSHDTISNINFQAMDNQVITGLQPPPPTALPNVEIAPNPFDKVLRINLGSDLKGTVRIRILNVNGQLMQEKAVEQEEYLEMATGLWPAGLYFVEIQDEQNQRKIQKAVKLK